MKILLAIDSSDASRKAVDFVGRMLGKNAAGHAVTLLHVVDSLPEFIVSGAKNPQSGEAFQKVASEWATFSSTEGNRVLNDYRKQLETAGVAPGAVETKLVTRDARPEARKVVAALAIIEEAKSSPYDVVCLGRRGTSSLSGVFPGSVAEKVLREVDGRTIWVVD